MSIFSLISWLVGQRFKVWYFWEREKMQYRKYGIVSEITGGLIYQDLCPLTLPYIIYNNAI